MISDFRCSLDPTKRILTAQSANNIIKYITNTLIHNRIKSRQTPQSIILKLKDYVIFIKKNGMALMKKQIK